MLTLKKERDPLSSMTKQERAATRAVHRRGCSARCLDNNAVPGHERDAMLGPSDVLQL